MNCGLGCVEQILTPGDDPTTKTRTLTTSCSAKRTWAGTTMPSLQHKREQVLSFHNHETTLAPVEISSSTLTSRLKYVVRQRACDRQG